ncbi:leucine-rich repeat domain-containing protein [Lacrimispora sp. NSJ-141]|uniref:Leucine-rich repeat domain-containing protein n=1 Tax=Lientehia hominis TaxID=2897778 RepID=A0AAP2RFT9_9FIRM|nr:leucine-rich repeat protein [Lientehia hominis]MCD2491212.1 leucine-rich repeat domain-containing protein [Lientehia hominis]
MRKTKKQNRWLILALCLCLLAGVFPLTGTTYAAEADCRLPNGHQGACKFPVALGDSLTGSMSDSITGDGYIFYPASGEMSVTANEGVFNWRTEHKVSDTDILSVVCTENVSEFGGDGFVACLNLTSVSLSANMTDYWGHPFDGCSNLTTIDVAPENPRYASADGALYDKEKWELLYYPAGRNGSFTVPEGVATVKEGAFLDCLGLTSVTLPGSVEILEQSSFHNCPSLTELYFTGDKAPTVGNYVFQDLPKQGTLFHIAGVTGFGAKKFGDPYLDQWERKPMGILPMVHGDVGYAGEQWWVIGCNGDGIRSQDGTMTLLYKGYLRNVSFDTQESRGGWENNQYGGSLLQAEMEKFYAGISPQEQVLILPQTLDNVRVGDDYRATLNGEQLVWSLSYDEAIRLPQDVRIIEGPWWLRSARITYCSVAFSNSTQQADLFERDGNITSSYVNNTFGSRPALTLKLDSVLFTADAAGGKPAAGSSLQEYATPTGTVKLTVPVTDSSLTLNVPTTDPITAMTGGTVSFVYENAKTGANHSVSVLIKDKATGDILYYGRPVDCTAAASAAGTAGFKLPDGLGEGEYTLLAFNEQVNGNNLTDFTSTPIELTLKVKSKFKFTGLPENYTLLVGQSVSWTPAPAGGSWSYDPNLLSMTQHGDTYTFKALKEGKATAAYTVDGVLRTVTITVNAIPQTEKSEVTGLPQSYAMLVGQSVSWTPAPAGGSWSYDPDLLSMTQHGDTYTFKALKEGKATAAYTVDGVPCTVTITINSSAIPQTEKSEITGLPQSYAMLVGQSVSWTPAPAGGSWSYDPDLLSMTRHGDTYTFKALKEGKATAAYTVDGVPCTVTITISSSAIPQTGDTSSTLPWLLAILTALVCCGGLMVYQKKKKEL